MKYLVLSTTKAKDGKASAFSISGVFAYREEALYFIHECKEANEDFKKNPMSKMFGALVENVEFRYVLIEVPNYEIY